MEKNEVKGGKKPSKTIELSKQKDQIVLNPKLEPNNNLNEKVIDLAQRRRRASLMRRVHAKMERKKEITGQRLHTPQQLSQSAERIAKNILRKRFAGARGAEYQVLAPSDKIQVDKIVDKKAKMIKAMAARLVPRLRSADVKRLQAKRSGEAVKGIQTYMSARPVMSGDELNLDDLVKLFEKVSDKVLKVLDEKASKHGIPSNILEAVFLRGLYESDEQGAFDRVNAFLAVGKNATEDDSDIMEDLRKWFSKTHPEGNWVRMNTKGEIAGPCAREEGEGKPKCLPLAKARAMNKQDRVKAILRKRREDPVADRAGKGGKPVNVATEEYIDEKSAPTNPSLWSKAKSLARSKFDVYPSAYANGWAAKWYKSKGGGWRSVSEAVDDEGGMAQGELKAIASKAISLSKKMKKNKQLDAWVQSKITKADDYIGSVHDYLMSGKQEVDESEIEQDTSDTKIVVDRSGKERKVRAHKRIFKVESFKQFVENYHGCCDDCEGIVEEDFEPTGLEDYEDWGEEDPSLLFEEVKGRRVSLNKPFLTPGGPKKRSVYVKHPSTGNVVKVNFGDPNMTIKKNDTARRRSFRARHNCENPGPKHKARYWSCRAW